MLAIYLIFTAAFALIAWRDLHLSLLLLIAMLPSYLLRTEIAGIPTTLLELLLVAFVTIWFLKRRTSPLTKGGSRGVLIAIWLLLLASLISLFIAPDLTAALGVWKAYFLEPILLFFIIRFEQLNASQIFKALGVTALILSLVAILQWITGQGIPIPWDIERRVTSVFDYPNTLGLFLGPIVVIGFLSLRVPARALASVGATEGSAAISTKGLLRSLKLPRNDKATWFWILTTILSLIAIVLAQSEAAIVAVLATLIMAGLLNKKTRTRTCLIVFVSIATILILPWRGFVIEKLTLQDYSGQVRLTQWSETFDMLEDNWLLGAGLSGYPTVFEPYHQATHIEIFQYPHNIFLNIWVELGLLGVLTFLLLAHQVVVSLRATKGSAAISEIASSALWPPRNDTVWITFLALLEITIHGLVDVPYFKNDLAILTWILLAIIFSYAPHTPPAEKKI